jgi:putative transcriptional regulator
MKKKTSEMGVFEMILAGLDDSIAYSKGEKRSLVATRIPTPPPPMDAQKVIQVRKRLGMSQSLFAAALNVSAKTVQSWEQGLRVPGNASLRLLQIAESQPQTVWTIIGGEISSPAHRRISK